MRVWFKHILLVNTKQLGVAKLQRKPSPIVRVCCIMWWNIGVHTLGTWYQHCSILFQVTILWKCTVMYICIELVLFRAKYQLGGKVMYIWGSLCMCSMGSILTSNVKAIDMYTLRGDKVSILDHNVFMHKVSFLIDIHYSGPWWRYALYKMPSKSNSREIFWWWSFQPVL